MANTPTKRAGKAVRSWQCGWGERSMAQQRGRLTFSVRAALAALLALGYATFPAAAGSDAITSGLPVPRFVSLKADRVMVRGGPDKAHDVAWIYTLAGRSKSPRNSRIGAAFATVTAPRAGSIIPCSPASAWPRCN